MNCMRTCQGTWVLFDQCSLLCSRKGNADETPAMWNLSLRGSRYDSISVITVIVGKIVVIVVIVVIITNNTSTSSNNSSSSSSSSSSSRYSR